MADISRKQAPKRDIVDIRKVGEWGNVAYHHDLSCGHTEIRKRIAPAEQMACTWCVVAERKDSELRELLQVKPIASQVIIDVADMIDVNDDVAAEQDAFRTQGSLASALGISPESIDVVLEDVGGSLVVSYALVFLSSADIRRITSKKNQIIDIDEGIG